jgi:hypothetical protein
MNTHFPEMIEKYQKRKEASPRQSNIPYGSEYMFRYERENKTKKMM